MFFHKSHCKKDILKIFKSLSVNIDSKLSKREIIENFDLYSLNCNYTERIKNLTELISYFNKPSTITKINSEDKKAIMIKCKRLIKYANSNYDLDESTYLNHQDAFKECMEIYSYGDIPSVRRACRLYNSSPYRCDHVNPKISRGVQEEIQEKKIIKKQYFTTLKVKQGKVLVYFD